MIWQHMKEVFPIAMGHLRTSGILCFSNENIEGVQNLLRYVNMFRQFRPDELLVEPPIFCFFMVLNNSQHLFYNFFRYQIVIDNKGDLL